MFLIVCKVEQGNHVNLIDNIALDEETNSRGILSSVLLNDVKNIK